LVHANKIGAKLDIINVDYDTNTIKHALKSVVSHKVSADTAHFGAEIVLNYL
jgi:hypothetical protein